MVDSINIRQHKRDQRQIQFHSYQNTITTTYKSNLSHKIEVIFNNMFLIEASDFYKKTKAVNKRLAIYGFARIAESCTEYNGRIKYRVQWKVYKPVLV